MEIIERFLKPEFVSRGHEASGNWQRSLDIRVEVTEKGFSSTITGPDYTYWLIYGRGPNKDQRAEAISNWARYYGQNVFDPWAKSKGLQLNPYAVAYKIAREGTREFREGDHSMLDFLEGDELRSFLNERVGSMIGINIKNDLLSRLKDAAKA